MQSLQQRLAPPFQVGIEEQTVEKRGIGHHKFHKTSLHLLGKAHAHPAHQAAVFRVPPLGEQAMHGFVHVHGLAVLAAQFQGTGLQKHVPGLMQHRTAQPLGLVPEIAGFEQIAPFQGHKAHQAVQMPIARGAGDERNQLFFHHPQFVGTGPLQTFHHSPGRTFVT